MTDDAAPRDGDDDLRIDAPLTDRDTDGVAALHDIEAEAGDENERVPEEPTLD
jgi:hypothetical protein